MGKILFYYKPTAHRSRTRGSGPPPPASSGTAPGRCAGTGGGQDHIIYLIQFYLFNYIP